MIDFSVIIPFYKAELYVRRCVEALLAQNYPANRFEILLVDNNSPDASARIIRQYEPRVRLLHEPRQGAYAARNHGLRESCGGILVFTDPDCVPQADWLSQIATAFERPDVQVVIGPTPSPPANSLPLQLLYAYEHQKERYVFSHADVTAYFGHTNNMAVRRQALMRFGPFHERERGADTIFVRRVADEASAAAVAYEPALRMQHLEIERLGDYFKKVYTYGRSHSLYSQVLPARELTCRERWMIYRHAVREHQLSSVQASMLLGLLMTGMLHWFAGARAARRVSSANVR